MNKGSLSRTRGSTYTHTALAMTRQAEWDGKGNPQTEPRTAEAVKCLLMSAAELGSRAQIPAVPLGGTALLLLNPSMDFYQLIS